MKKFEFYQDVIFIELPTWFCVTIVAFMSVICYSNSYYGAFVFDDSEAVVNNQDVNLKTPVIKIFSHDFWGTRLTNRASHKSYRPLTILSFRYLLLHCFIFFRTIDYKF